MQQEGCSCSRQDSGVLPRPDTCRCSPSASLEAFPAIQLCERDVLFFPTKSRCRVLACPTLRIRRSSAAAPGTLPLLTVISKLGSFQAGFRSCLRLPVCLCLGWFPFWNALSHAVSTSGHPSTPSQVTLRHAARPELSKRASSSM